MTGPDGCCAWPGAGGSCRCHRVTPALLPLSADNVSYQGLSCKLTAASSCRGEAHRNLFPAEQGWESLPTPSGRSRVPERDPGAAPDQGPLLFSAHEQHRGHRAGAVPSLRPPPASPTARPRGSGCPGEASARMSTSPGGRLVRGAVQQPAALCSRWGPRSVPGLGVLWEAAAWSRVGPREGLKLCPWSPDAWITAPCSRFQLISLGKGRFSLNEILLHITRV